MPRKLVILLAIFVALVIGMNVLGSKIMAILGISVSVGIFMSPLTFLITDIVEDVYGPKMSREFVMAGAVALGLTFIYTAVFVALPPHERYPYNDQYRLIFGSSLRIMVASFVAFLLAQFHDVWAFALIKKLTGGKALWLRNNVSTIISQAIDTLVFMYLAFYQAAQKFTALFVLGLALPYYGFKVAFALLDTPLVYLGVRWLKSKEEKVV